MNRTKIEWVKNPDGSQGYTWNPITGCLNGCEYCYARKLANGRLRSRYLANEEVAITGFDMVYIDGNDPKYQDPFYPRAWFDRREPALERKKPKGIFVCDMSDLFGIGIPEEWTQHVITLMRLSPQHRFYLLTKQPQNLAKFSPFPANCWVGVTATNRQMFIEALRGLKDVRASVKYISIEPCLERVFSNEGWIVEHAPDTRPDDAFMLTLTGIQLVIIGSLTLTLADYNNSNYALRRGLKLRRWGKKWTVQPDIEWVREIVETCDEAGVVVFLKNNLGWPRLSADGALPFYKRYPSGTMELRQEMPNVV